MMLVSVIVPVYNVEKYLNRCVGSILGQTYREMEVILIDDGSTDSSGALCDEWAAKDERIIVIHKANAGLGMARNSGLDIIKGEAVCFVDSDDYIDSCQIEHAVKRMQGTGADLVLFGCNRVRADGAVLKSIVPYADPHVYRGDEVKGLWMERLASPTPYKGKGFAPHGSACCLLYRASMIRESGWRFVSERDIIAEDSYSLLLLYQYVTCVAVLPEALYNYQVTTGSLTQTYREDRFPKIVSYYLDCKRACDECGYSERVCRSCASPFLSFTLAALKQVEASDLSRSRKLEEIGKICADSVLHEVLTTCDEYIPEGSQGVFWRAVYRQRVILVQAMLALRRIRERMA